MKIMAAVIEEQDGPWEIRDLVLDDPGQGEVVVQVVATGICHTDGLARHGDLPFPLPGVLGHEGAGIVVAIGPGVDDVDPGDRVVIGWPFCGLCAHCTSGQPRYCLRLGEQLVGGGRPGGATALHRPTGQPISSHFFGQSSFASHCITTAKALVKVPEHLPLELMGPLACGVSTGAGAVFNTARPGPGSSVVVFGAGTVGLSAIMAARLSPATRIIAVDRHPSRLALARDLGATDVIGAGEDDVVGTIVGLCGGPADFALECTGVVSVVRQAADCVGMLGTCILIGGAPAGAEFKLDHLSTLWGKKIVGVLGGGGQSGSSIGTIMRLFDQGRFPFDRLVEYFDFVDIAAAIDASYAGGAIKPILRFPQ
ncbi:aryl-alcohol dehydrogenase [Nakamurella sp. UYEF19]|uniref:NAD(P)-dependent alcohol dehydrogenase n=1 Tax=Nakamurella sp. UYEF19 TaxID=1756392 RepID=UPI0033991686